MRQLLEAIQVTADNSSLPSIFPNGCELSKAKDGSALPICVLTVVSNPPDYNTGTPYTEETTIQFSMWASKDETATADLFLVDALNLLDSLFNRQTLTLSTESFLDGRRVGSSGPYMEDERVWRLDSTYRFTVQR